MKKKTPFLLIILGKLMLQQGDPAPGQQGLILWDKGINISKQVCKYSMKLIIFNLIISKQLNMEMQSAKIACQPSGHWSKKEEEMVKRLIEVEGISNWTTISKTLAKQTGNKTFSAKQCRERYINFIKFSQGRDSLLKWSEEQEDRLFSLYEEMGSKWGNIAKHFQFKSQNNLKNKFYGAIRKLNRKLNRVGKDSGILKKPVRYQSLVKPLQFSEEHFEGNQQSAIALKQLRKIILNAARSQGQPDNELYIDLIKRINAFSLKTRSIHGRGKQKLMKPKKKIEIQSEHAQCSEDKELEEVISQKSHSHETNNREFEKHHEIESVESLESPKGLIDLTLYELKEDSIGNELCLWNINQDIDEELFG